MQDILALTQGIADEPSALMFQGGPQSSLYLSYLLRSIFGTRSLTSRVGFGSYSNAVNLFVYPPVSVNFNSFYDANQLDILGEN